MCKIIEHYLASYCISFHYGMTWMYISLVYFGKPHPVSLIYLRDCQVSKCDCQVSKCDGQNVMKK